jgi:hypothetical protein
MDFAIKDRHDLDYLFEVIEYSAKERGLGFRSIEKIAASIALSLAYSRKDVLRIEPVIGGLCVMKFLEPKLYKKAQEGSLKFTEADDFFGFSRGDKSLSYARDLPAEFAFWWKVVTGEKLNDEETQRFDQVAFRYDVRDRTNLLRWTTHNIVESYRLGSLEK